MDNPYLLMLLLLAIAVMGGYYYFRHAQSRETRVTDEQDPPAAS